MASSSSYKILRPSFKKLKSLNVIFLSTYFETGEKYLRPCFLLLPLLFNLYSKMTDLKKNLVSIALLDLWKSFFLFKLLQISRPSSRAQYSGFFWCFFLNKTMKNIFEPYQHIETFDPSKCNCYCINKTWDGTANKTWDQLIPCCCKNQIIKHIWNAKFLRIYVGFSVTCLFCTNECDWWIQPQHV